MTKLVYIGGYGRSGSTLLEYLLTASPAAIAMGEVARHFQRFGQVKTCTCGRPSEDCPVWKSFQHDPGKLEGWNHERLTLAMLEHLSGQYAVMVDASKTAWGSFLVPFRLHRRLGPDFLLIHLVRDPRAVCWSTIRTAKKHQDTRLTSVPVIRCLRSSVGWVVANVACELFARFHPHHYMRLNYEQLTLSPRETLRAILERVSVEAPPSLERAEGIDNRHQLYGNSMRFKPLSLTDVRQDVAWRQEMPKRLTHLATGLCWPLGVRYGYFGFSAAKRQHPPSSSDG